MADPAGGPRPPEAPKTWRSRLTEGVLGLAGGLAVNALSADFGYRGVVLVAGVAAVLLAVARVRRLPKRAPLVRIASVGALAAAIVAMILASFAPEEWQATAVVVAVIFATGAVLLPSDPEEALNTLIGVSAVGFGVSFIGFGVAALVEGDTLFGVSFIGIGVAAIGSGVAALVEGDTLFGVFAIGGGVSFIGIGVALIGYGVAGLVGRYTLFGLVAIGLGVSATGLGLTALVGRYTLTGLGLIGFGVALVCFGVAGLRSSKLMSTISALTRDPEKRDCGP